MQRNGRKSVKPKNRGETVNAKKMETTKQTELSAICAKRGEYQFADIPQAWKKTEYCRADADTSDIPDFLKTISGYEVGKYFECRTQDEGTPKELHYIEHSYIYVKKTGNRAIMLLRKDYNNKYTFHLSYFQLRSFQDISHYKRQDALKGLKEPNMIGVFSEKKLNDWAQHCEDYLKVMESLCETVNEKNKEIEAKISAFIASVPGAEVQTHGNKTWVTTPLFEVIFEHFKDQNYLSEKIQYTGGLYNVTKITNLLNS